MFPDSLRPSDAGVVARYLEIRALLHDGYLAGVERLILGEYVVEPSNRMVSTLVSHVRGGFVRPDEGEMWPVVFLTTVDVSVALCVELPADRIAKLGTMAHGPRRVRQRGWEDWVGWERPVSQLCTGFFDLSGAGQEEVIHAWYADCLEWLADAGLLRRRRPA